MIIFTSACGVFPSHLKVLQSAICKHGVRWSFAVRRIIAICSLAGILGPGSLAADSSQDNQSIAAENPGAAVEIDGRPILVVYAHFAGFTPQERAAAIEQRIIDLGKRRDTLRPKRFVGKSVVRGPRSWPEMIASWGSPRPMPWLQSEGEQT